MLSKKDKGEIVKIIIDEVNSRHIKRLKEIVENINYNTMYPIHEWNRNGRFNNLVNLDGYYLNLVLKQKVENNSPKGGITHDYIIVSKNKDNIEKIDFIKEFIKIY